MSTVPARQTFVVGTTVHIACNVIAYPKPTFVWRHNAEEYGESGHDVDSVVTRRGDVLVDSDRISYDADGRLTISDAMKEDAGEWECVATNALGVGTGIAILDYIGQFSPHFAPQKF